MFTLFPVSIQRGWSLFLTVSDGNKTFEGAFWIMSLYMEFISLPTVPFNRSQSNGIILNKVYAQSVKNGKEKTVKPQLMQFKKHRFLQYNKS